LNIGNQGVDKEKYLDLIRGFYTAVVETASSFTTVVRGISIIMTPTFLKGTYGLHIVPNLTYTYVYDAIITMSEVVTKITGAEVIVDPHCVSP